MKRMKAGALILALALVVMLAGCGAQPGEESGQEQQQEQLLSGKHHVEINVQDYGTIAVELDADAAPVTVTNFVNLAKNGFYDGLTFHRVASGFVLQGGDPNGDGTGGSGESITGEFAENGWDNPIRFPFLKNG